MSDQTLVFNDVKGNKKDFYSSKKTIPLNLVDVNKIVTSYRIKQNNDTCKYYIGYKRDGVIKPLCVVLYYHK